MLLPTITEWAKRNAVVTFIALGAIGLLGAWLVGLFETESTPPEDITGLDLVVSFLGLLMLCVGLLGIVLLIAARRKSMAPSEGVAWERIRSKGKWSYVRNSSIRASITIIVAMLFLALIDRSRGNASDLKIYAVLTVAIIGCAIYAAIRFWGYYESEYHALQSKPQHNNSLDRSGDSASPN
jgi:uncharacterized BrkB/YihY/UPF0761 family membrane protein